MDHNRNSDRRPIKSKSRQRASDAGIEGHEKFAARAKVIQRCQRIASRASGSAARTFLALLSFANAEGYCWPLASTLTEVTKLGRSRLFLALSELESHGVIDRRMLVSRVNGRNAPTLYRVGGKVTRLPQNAERYILANKRKPHSRWRKRREVHQTRTSKPMADIPVSGMGVVLETGMGVVLETGIQKLPMEVAAPIEAADAVAGGSFVEEDRALPGKNFRAISHRHPPLRPTAKYDDDERMARLMAKARTEFDSKHKGEVDPRRLTLIEQVVMERTIANGARIRSENYFVRAIENECTKESDTRAETNVGSGPERNVTRERWCRDCDHNEFFHNRMLVNKMRFDKRWIEHSFVDRTQSK